MKKTIITLAIIFGLGLGVYAQGGLFGYGAVSDEEYYGYGPNDRSTTGGMPLLPGHGETENAPAAPLGGGALLLIGFGAAYALKKKREE